MGLVAGLNNSMLEWEQRVIKTTPTIPQIKRAWLQKQYALIPYLAGLKAGMDAAYAGVKGVWDAELKIGPYNMGQNKNEGIEWVNRIQDQGIWAKKAQIPNNLTPVTERWNKGQLLEALYLAGVRQGWIMVWNLIFSVFQQVWVQNHGFPP